MTSHLTACVVHASLFVVLAELLRQLRFCLCFLEQRFHWIRFPVPVRILAHPDNVPDPSYFLCFLLHDLRWPDPRESIHRYSRESLQGARTESLFCESRLGNWNYESQVWGDLRESLEPYESRFFFLFRELIRVNRPDSRCESLGNLIRGR